MHWPRHAVRHTMKCCPLQVKCSSRWLLVLFRGGSRGRVQGVRTPPPPPPEMTCGFLIQLVFCKKNNSYVVYWCWSRARDECTRSYKNSWIRPCYSFMQKYLAEQHLWGKCPRGPVFCASHLSSLSYCCGEFHVIGNIKCIWKPLATKISTLSPTAVFIWVILRSIRLCR